MYAQQDGVRGIFVKVEERYDLLQEVAQTDFELSIFAVQNGQTETSEKFFVRRNV